jgi:hypothetical protein
MHVQRDCIRWGLAFWALAAGVLLLGMAAGVTPAAAIPGSSAGDAPMARPQPTREMLDCSWKLIGSSTRNVMHTGSAMDTDANKLYIYGGMNESQQAQISVELADLSGAALSATHRPVAAGGTLPLMGSAGAYRAKGATSDLSAVYFFGGTGDPGVGQAANDVQRYLTNAAKWERVTPANEPTFTARLWAAAAYDAGHDVLWVVGGIGKCALGSVVDGKPCTARAIDTVYLTFDPATGDHPAWHALPGGALALYGHSLVYDAAGKRLLAFGGTSDIKSGSSVLRALDLSDPDPAAATWSVLATTGTAPSLYFHGASFDVDWRWMVTYGGVRSGYLQTNESANGQTNYLDRNASPPNWSDLRPLGSPGDRIGSAMAFDPLHGAGIVTLGRKKIAYSAGTPVPDVQRTTWGLECVAAAPTPVPTIPTPSGQVPKACPSLSNHVPPAVIANALANPTRIQGWGELCFPSQPPSPYNGPRTWLVLDRPVTYHPLYNSVVFECGCR